jgi:hypothetical protein
MKKTILFLWAFVMLLSISMKAQTLSPSVISSSGAFYSVGGNSLSVTVAEMTMVQSFIQPTNMLTQGFQQPEQLTTVIAENEVMHGDLLVYPNPTNGQFNMSYNAVNDADYIVRIFNSIGQVVFDQSYGAAIGSNKTSFDIGKFRQGIYMLELSTTDSNGKQRSSIYKINLVY